MNSLSRRSFLRAGTLGAAALTLPSSAWSRVYGANEEIRVGVVGIGGRGGDHISEINALAKQGIRVVALCDADSRILAAGVDSYAKKNQKVEGYKDFRKMLENRSIDAVSIATPNHWHALMVVWACQAGKDVYVEKPISHNVWEGRKAVEAARKYRCIVQAGTQSRSSREGIAAAVQWVQTGNLGKILVARGLCYKPRRSIGKVDGAQPVPPEIDYDLWCGPAPLAPLMRKRLHYDWHWVWDTGNGDLGNQGIHQMDIARWFLGENTVSPAILSVGGRLGYVDDGQTPNTQFVFHGYAKAPLIFEVRGLPKGKEFQTDKDWNGNMDAYQGGRIGVIVHCENGHVLVPDYRSAVAVDKSGKTIRTWSGAEDHFANWIKAMRSRKASDLHGDILEGHLSSALCHTGNVSILMGASASPGEIREALKDNRSGLDTYERMAAHLDANGVDVTRDRLTLGMALTMDPKSEDFKGSKLADRLLRRDYRKPYEVPARV